MKRIITATLFFVCIFCLPCLSADKAMAQNEKTGLVKLDEITVTAEKFPMDERKSDRFITINILQI